MGEEPGKEGKPTDKEAYLKDLQAAATLILTALRGKQALKDEVVGYRHVPEARPSGDLGPEGRPPGGVDDELSEWQPVSFVPGQAPTGTAPPPPQLADKLPSTPNERLQDGWDQLELVVGGLETTYPSLYGLHQHGSEAALSKFAEAKGDEGPAQVVEALHETQQTIRETKDKIPSLGPDLKPIQEQLCAGAVKGDSGVDWKNPVRKAIAEDVIEGHEETDFWVELGLSSLAAAAFVVASFATGGMAAVALGAAIGIGAGQAAASWEKAITFQTASKASLSKETELITSGQASIATFEAVLDTAFAIADIAQAPGALAKIGARTVAKEMVAAGRQVGKLAAAGLESIATAPPGVARKLLDDGIRELGVEAVKTRTGLTYSRMLELATSPTAARIKEFLKVSPDLLELPAAEFAKRSGNLAAEVVANREVAEQLAVLAVERLGPLEVVRRNGGWVKLSMALGNDSRAGQAIMAWRDGMEGEIKEFVKTLPGGEIAGEIQVKRTGSMGKFTNDFDISLLGEHSSKNRDAVRSFVAGRVGASPGKLKDLLHADFFTDPARLHLYDKLAPAVRAEIASRTEKTSEAVIFARTLHEAEESGNKAVADRLREMMKARGVDETAFEKLGNADRNALYAEIDNLHGQLDAAVEAGDVATQKELAIKIGETQGLINASEGGGYFSAGGVRELVTKQEALLRGMPAEALPAQAYAALLDQLPKLYDEANALLKVGFVASEDAVAAIKGIGKYGKRFNDLMAKLGVAAPAEGQWEVLARDLEKLLKQSKGEADIKMIDRLASEADVVKGEVESALGRFQSASEQVLALLHRQAGLQGEAVNLANLQMATMAHAKLLRAQAAVRTWLVSATAHGGRLGEAVAGGEDGGEDVSEP